MLSRDWWVKICVALAVLIVLCVVAALVVWHAPGENKGAAGAGLACCALIFAVIGAGASK